VETNGRQTDGQTDGRHRLLYFPYNAVGNHAAGGADLVEELLDGGFLVVLDGAGPATCNAADEL